MPHVHAPDSWTGERPKLTIDDLRRTVAGFPAEIRESYGRRHYVLCMHVLNTFLGQKWCEETIVFPDRGFLQIHFDDDKRRERTSLHIFELAENIFNLQTRPGFYGCLTQLKTARTDSAQIESTYAELEFGRILFHYDLNFRFLARQATKSPDYELICRDGIRSFADAKCKVEGSAVTESTIRNSIKDAWEQIPKDGPGIVFIKIPQDWAESRETRVLMRDTAVNYLRGTGRLASIKYYAAVVTHPEPTMMLRQYAFLEVSNPKCRAGPNRNWDLFSGFAVPSEWAGKHPRWVRLSDIANEQ